MLTSSPGHILGEPVEGTHDLGDRVDADVEQFTTYLAYAATYNVRVRDIRERNGSEVRTNGHRENTGVAVRHGALFKKLVDKAS